MMKAMMTLHLMMLTCLGTTAFAAKVDPAARKAVYAACMAQTAAAEASHELSLKVSREDFCGCMAGKHEKAAKQSRTDQAAAAYMKEVYEIYKPTNKSESEQARAAYPTTDEIDMASVSRCDAY
jgi:phage-related tail fiber protein